MIVDIERLKDEGNLTISDILSFKGKETRDALIQSIDTLNVTVNAVEMGNDEYHLTFDYTANIKYLDARNLKPLDLTFDFHDDIIFTSDFQKAEEFELEYFEGDTIELDELLFELTCVSIPVNYSEDESGNIQKESSIHYENKPFADIFNK